MADAGLGGTGAHAVSDRQFGPAERTATSGADPLLALEDISKRFPGVLANDQVTFAVGRCEIHALLGENGAGKSTLVKLVYGLMRPDTGRMTLAGAPYAPLSPADARAQGVGLVFQHFSLFEALTVAENIALGIGRQRADRTLKARIAATSATYGLELDPDRQVGTLSVGERQRVEIVRCLLQAPRLIIMDEPTSVLAPQEVEALFATLRRLVAEGRSILYISHKLEEIRALCSRATILRAGRVAASCDPRQESAQKIAAIMLGGTLPSVRRSHPPAIGPVRLRLNALSLAKTEQFGVDLANIEIEVRGGEIVGIAGVAGNGQAELMDALTGERLAVAARTIELDGSGVGRKPPRVRRALGLLSVREERLGHASVPAMTLWENGVLTAEARRHLSRRGLLDKARARNFAAHIVADFAVSSAGVESSAERLSGGNLQKFLVGREILQAPGVLVVAQPTWGVDVGAAATIHARLLALASAGAAILIISQDLDELFAVADRIAVIANGRLSRAEPVNLITAAGLGLSMAGLSMAGLNMAGHHRREPADA
ncbi:MAG TPA: ABC transporter ATP-binding protein [Hyphomicrobiaceae bacterium]|nr:ABC transporter ATP-binding protein [Hyphomicrobiaceae bacterium]